jgi:hypothetical protein
MADFIQQSKVAEIKQQYHSINSLQSKEKIQAVKDTSLNPFLFDDPYDGLANSLSRWSQEAPKFAGKTDSEKLALASRYYDEALAPLYQKMGAAPLSRDLWLRNAWKSGLSYDPAQAYRNPMVKGALEGLDSAIGETANALRTITNITGLPIVAMEDSIRSGDFTGLVGWQNLYLNMHNRVKESGLVTGIAKAIEDTGERNPTGGSKWMHDIASQEDFWSGVTPARTFTEKASSFVVENAMLLPLFSGIGKATELGIGLAKTTAEGVPMLANLTETLGASKVGQTAAKMLTYGTEGLAFGELTLDSEDKKDAWKMGLQFAAMGTLFSMAGKGAAKLVDHLPEGAEKDAMAAAEHEADLGAQGKRSATSEEYLEQYQTHMASVMAAGGRPAASSIIEEALAHVTMEEKAPMEELDRLKFHQDMSDKDPVKWKTVFSNMRIIRQFLDRQGWKISEFKPDDARWGDLRGFLDGQLDKAASRMDSDVPQVQQMKGQELVDEYMKTPEGQAEWKQELAKAQEVFKNHPGGAEKAPVVAKAAMLKRRVAAVQKAAEERTVTGPENVKRNQLLEPNWLINDPEGSKDYISKHVGLYNESVSHAYSKFDNTEKLAAKHSLVWNNRTHRNEPFAIYVIENDAYQTQRGVLKFTQGNEVSHMALHPSLQGKGIMQRMLEIAGEDEVIPAKRYTTDPKPALISVDGARVMNKWNSRVRTPPQETAAQRTESRYEYDKTGKVTGYQMAISFNWKVAADKAATAKGGKNSPKFWQEYVDTLAGKTDDDVSAAHALAEDLREYFNPLKESGIQFEKSNAEGGDWTNFLAYMYSYKDRLPKPVARKLEDVLMNSPKMRTLLGRKTTTAGIEEFSQAIQNHIDIFTRSKWYKELGQRNAFRSTQPGIKGSDSLSPWQRDKKLIESAQQYDLKQVKTFFPGRSKAAVEARSRYQNTLTLLHERETAAYLKGNSTEVTKIMKRVRETLAQAGGQ